MATIYHKVHVLLCLHIGLVCCVKVGSAVVSLPLMLHPKSNVSFEHFVHRAKGANQ